MIPMGENYWCDVCNYFYVPSRGDPTQDIPPGTEFEDLPDDWHCPICFNEKNNFVRGEY